MGRDRRQARGAQLKRALGTKLSDIAPASAVATTCAIAALRSRTIAVTGLKTLSCTADARMLAQSFVDWLSIGWGSAIS